MNKMDEITTKMMAHICDNLCKYPGEVVGETDLLDICVDCKMAEYVHNILNNTIDAPVRTGDTVYEPMYDNVLVDPYYINQLAVEEVSDRRFWANECEYDFSELGVGVFLTRDGAEKKIEEWKNAILNTRLEPHESNFIGQIGADLLIKNGKVPKIIDEESEKEQELDVCVNLTQEQFEKIRREIKEIAIKEFSNNLIKIFEARASKHDFIMVGLSNTDERHTQIKISETYNQSSSIVSEERFKIIHELDN